MLIHLKIPWRYKMAKQSESQRSWKVTHYWMPIIGLIAVLVAVVAGGVSLSKGRTQAASGSSGDWPTYLRDNARTGFNSAETAITATTVQNLKVHWTYS